MQSAEEVREYKAEKKREERAIEKHLIKYKAWERYPGESYKDFKKRFVSKKIFISDEELKYDNTST